MEILYRIWTESEASIGSKFPLQPVTLDKLAASTGIEPKELFNQLEIMANKGLISDMVQNGETYS
jgi:predicted Rossmann fold nucleotide-binding protein DprA/Smf involved in DNA uptake